MKINDTFLDISNYNRLVIPDTNTHLLVAGRTGSGKTRSTLFLIAKALLQNSNSVDFYFADYKNGGDYRFALNTGHLLDMQSAIDNACYALSSRQAGLPDRYPYVVVLDEYPSFILSLDSKDRKDYQSKLATLLNLGRAFEIHVWVITQRPGAELFANGSRDNFNCRIVMGMPSPETRRMMLGDDISEVPADWLTNNVGQGLIYRDGLGISHIAVPQLNWQKLNMFLKNSFKK
ncbi:type IV secretory system conjugative DNA transfer family protein [Limosilactobacillus reuteri]|uniref:FtsK domain-containing protein n=1 Tax=Limosilactobacillus reuteri TaxID=1598 RepID=A0A256SLV0_LIMRT|nr:FtsK/SpoIIIE domain-containing protein [Limosilactobacillus reuteri]OYS67817.1 hypothetical protein CBF96_08680 [Limosilactobacillus reuteri]